MTKPELGVKRDCPECGARFYDLNKEPAQCPKCEHEFVPESLLKPRKTRAEEVTETAEKDVAAKPAAETTLENADQEKKGAKSNRRAALDEDDDMDDDDDDELGDIEDIDVDIDDDDDDSLLDDDEDDDDVSTMVRPGGDDE